MNTIFTIGETIYDIIFDHGQPVAAKAGGSMLNTAVSLGRCGLPVEMITELGDDQVGQLVVGFLKDNGVSVNYTSPSADFKTPVSLAFLDEQRNAQYSFYKQYPKERLGIEWPEANRGDVVLFGSFYSLDRAIHDKIISFVKKARQNGAFIIYDPNIRKNHLAEIRSMMHLVMENISLADLVRGSDEDFENLLGFADDESVFEQIKNAGCGHLIITRGNKGAALISDGGRIHVPSKEIEVLSSIGAGDSFNAGIIYVLVNHGLTFTKAADIKPESWRAIMEFGVIFASEVCQGFDNYIPKDLYSRLHGTN